MSNAQAEIDELNRDLDDAYKQLKEAREEANAARMQAADGGAAMRDAIALDPYTVQQTVRDFLGTVGDLPYMRMYGESWDACRACVQQVQAWAAACLEKMNVVGVQ